MKSKSSGELSQGKKGYIFSLYRIWYTMHLRGQQVIKSQLKLKTTQNFKEEQMKNAMKSHGNDPLRKE